MYDTLSSAYDKMVDWPGRLALEIPFLAGILRGNGARRIFDAACGTGMHAIALASDGFSVAGSDASSAMIERARANAAERNLELLFRTAEFGRIAPAFAGEPRYDAVLCLGNSLPHLPDAAALSDTLADFRSLLAPGGLVLLQNRNFESVLERRERWMEPQSHAGPGGEYLFVRFYDFEPDGRILFHILTLHRAPGGPWRQTETATRLWPQRKTELESALAGAGFSPAAAYGFIDGAAFDPQHSPNLIILARRNEPHL